MANYHKHFSTHREQFRRFYKLPSMAGLKGPGYMSRKNAFEITEYGAEIFARLDDSTNLPGWMEHKLSIARQALGDVKHKLEFAQKMGEIPTPKAGGTAASMGGHDESTSVPTFGDRKSENLAEVPTFGQHKNHYRG